MLSDLSGYTAMNEVLDPEEVSEVLGRIKEEAKRIVKAHGGMVNQFVGDEVMALFGLPTAHEDDARLAVSAALELHSFVRQLSAEVERRLKRPLYLHTSMATGLVLVQASDIRDGFYRVTGDTVNAAARMLSKAEKDEILVGASTYRLIAPFFRLEELDPLQVKGRAQPLIAFRVLGPEAHTSFEAAQRRGLTRHVGRRQEMEKLETMLARTAEGTGSLVTVSGPPGLGKSRLFHEVVGCARQRGVRVLRGRCDAFGNIAPYQPFLHVLREALELGEGRAPEAVLSQVSSAVRLLEDPELERRLPFLLHLLSLRSPQHPLPQELDGDQLRVELAESIQALLRALAERQPVVVLLEDWHWADAASEAVMRHLVGLPEGAPVSLLVSHRDYYSPAWGAQPMELKLRPMRLADTTAIIHALLGGAGSLPARMPELVHLRTGGIPFFIEELCRELLERGVVVAGPDGPRLAQELTRLDMPDSVQAVVRARIDRLGSVELEVLALAAVMGVELPLRLLERLVAMKPEQLAGVVERLKAADMIWEDSTAREPTYRFRHVIIQEVAYDAVTLGQRRALHARVGEALEELYADQLANCYEALAHHYGRGERYEKAALYAEKAGDKAARSYALEEARQQYQRAQEFFQRLEPTPEFLRRRVDLVIRWGEVAIYKPTARQVNALEECYAIANQIGYRRGIVRCGYWAGYLQYALGNQAEAVWHFERVLPLAQEFGEERLVTQLQLNLGQSYAAATQYQRALEYFEKGRAVRGASSARPNPGLAYALGHLGMLYGDQGRFTESYRCLEEGLEMTRTLGRRSVEGSVTTQLAMVQLWQGDWDACVVTARWLRAEAERMGAPFISAMSKTVEGFARFHLSGGLEPLSLLREAVAWLEENDTRLAISWNYACLAEPLALAGETKEAIQWANKALTRAHAWDRRGQAMAHRALGVAALRQSAPEPAAAREHLERSIDVARNKQSQRDEALSRFRLVESLLELNEEEEAERQLEVVLQSLEEMDMRWYHHQASALGMVRRAG